MVVNYAMNSRAEYYYDYDYYYYSHPLNVTFFHTQTPYSFSIFFYVVVLRVVVSGLMDDMISAGVLVTTEGDLLVATVCESMKLSRVVAFVLVPCGSWSLSPA
jgi:hypothetical protein